ncbi:TIGR01457 family HAD-type hydrolase [Paenibacillus sacheonensis]|uniref:Acid sugar phosphatase n=1 Tax=Paenibacillus sacheonensis TaxID=742054 RepID=A0A7X4YKJ3_9BACL|nr:TIGR01457 family HAD-type hydrolase [Paenibacillus sacheonensis]MBM7563364.1 4-nitrophenyl phosphatase [Paenibacillus sacheonensis]NBC68081.1 TIGR01457 family HAD-type hydrolase [Paenibacillus sacheonensis]
MGNGVNHLRGLLIDLDGTLYHGSKMIPGADALIHMLRKEEIRYLYVTNNSSATPEAVADRLNGMGIPAMPDDVCTSAQAAAAYIAERSPGARVHAVGEAGLLAALREAGLQLDDEAPELVVQGIDRSLTYDKITAAVRHIRGGAQYILTNPDLLLPSENGLIPGAGSISAVIRAASGAEPVVIGKPSAIQMHFALKRLGLEPNETWVIGDNPATDIAAGNAVGCQSVLVLTGVATGDNYKELLASAGCGADEVIADLHRLREWLGSQLTDQRQR